MSQFAGTVLRFAGRDMAGEIWLCLLLGIIINSVPFRSETCPGLNHKLHGHLA